MKVEVGKKAILISLPKSGDYKIGQVLTVTRIYQEMGSSFADVRGTTNGSVFLHRLRPFTPLDEALS